MTNKQSLRKKLTRRKSFVQERDATQVIMLDTVVDDAALISLVKSGGGEDNVLWSEIFKISDIKNPEALKIYKQMLGVLGSQIRNEPGRHIKSHIRESLQHFHASTLVNTEHGVFGRKTRKEIFKRLIALFDGIDFFLEGLSAPGATKVVLSNRLSLRVHKLESKIESMPLFYCEEELAILMYLLSQKIAEKGVGTRVLLENNDESVIVEEFKAEDTSSVSFIVSKHYAQGSSLLDLIRAKMINPVISRSLSQIIREKESGILISGGVGAGKSRLVSALLSTLPANRIPLVISNKLEMASSHPNAHIIDSEEVARLIRSRGMEEFAAKAGRLGVSDVFIEVTSMEHFKLVEHLVTLYSIYPVVSVRSTSPESIIYFIQQEIPASFIASHLSVILMLHESESGASMDSVLEAQCEHDRISLVPLVVKREGSSNWFLSEVRSEKTKLFEALMEVAK
jgi:hypothetical protein